MIRTAKPEDYDQIKEIIQQGHRMHVKWRPDVYCDTDAVFPQSYFKELCDNDGVIVCEEIDRIVGIALYKVKTVRGGVMVPKKTLFVDTMVVLEEHRGKGVGHALFDALKNTARQKDCGGIELQVNAKNEEAMKMYKNYGFSEKSINMELYF